MRLIIGLLLIGVKFLSAQEIGDFDYVFTSLSAAENNPDAVYRLSLKKQKLEEIPQSIYSFQNLRYLNLEKNKISQIPSSIGKLTLLEEVNLSNNKISIIPPQVGELKELNKLILAKNEIERLPEQLRKLQKLKELNLWSNNIKVIGEGLLELKGLQILDLRGMPIVNEIKEAVVKGLPNTEVLLTGGCECNF